MIAYLLIFCLRFYQRFLSPFLGSRCRFYPSCSEYAILVLQQRRLFVAIKLVFDRIFRCQPFHKGGICLKGVK